MILYAQPISEKIRNEIKEDVTRLTQAYRKPKLVVILVGENTASKKYVGAKQKACSEVGFDSILIKMEENITEKYLLNEIEKLNKDQTVDGILVQLPLPKHIDVEKVIKTIAADKDVDGFHPLHVGEGLIGNKCIVPCTPKGIMHFFEYVNYDLTGKNVVIVGRSNIVAKPLIGLLLQKNATVTITHSKTVNLPTICSNADVVIVAIGRARFIKENYIKEDAFVIDVGINVDENGKLCGDVDFENVKDKCKYITPVPKGVGVMTITMLLENTLELYKNNLITSKN